MCILEEQVRYVLARKNTETGAHEVGHTLGFDHLAWTTMSKASNYQHYPVINETIVGTILKKAGIGSNPFYSGYFNNDVKSNKVFSSGKAPKNFNEGKVVLKDKVEKNEKN